MRLEIQALSDVHEQAPRILVDGEEIGRLDPVYTEERGWDGLKQALDRDWSVEAQLDGCNALASGARVAQCGPLVSTWDVRELIRVCEELPASAGAPVWAEATYAADAAAAVRYYPENKAFAAWMLLRPASIRCFGADGSTVQRLIE